MATLAAISFTMVGGIAVFGATITAFGVAVKRRSVFVAARCVARPPNVIYNPKPAHPCQDRGDPTVGWIMWVMRLTYDTMLRGIPGTGTRDGGLSGALLKVNLDGIVLLRFHHLCLRVCFLAMLLFIVVVLPLYKTAQCSRIGSDEDAEDADEIAWACQQSNLTDYQRLTLANVPTLAAPKSERFADIFYSFFLPVHDGLLARLYAVVFCAWIVTWYCLRELQIEWGEVLAMRRVYYLEADHWSDRNEELQETLLREESEKRRRQRQFFHPKRTGGDEEQQQQQQQQLDDDTYMKNRDPWVPHPEQRDTVPNVELYSILVGGLPSLPTEVINQENFDAVFSRKQSIDWQLTVTTAFFDHCVPNQPGFSSSVAAVTILPAADQLTDAWNQWYKAAGKLRRLRFIRKEIAKRRSYEIDDEAYPEDEEDASKIIVADGSSSLTTTTTTAAARRRRKKQQTTNGEKNSNNFHTESTVYTDSKHKQQYFQEVLGSTTDLDVESNLLHALDFGPEQTAVYSREFALGAANLAPNGWNEGKVKRARIDELLEMEKIAVREVHEANQDLKLAQGRIAESSEGDSDNEVSDEDMHRIMKSAGRASSARGSFRGLESSSSEDSEHKSVTMVLDDTGCYTTPTTQPLKDSSESKPLSRRRSGNRLFSKKSSHSNFSRSTSGGSELDDSFANASADDLDIEKGRVESPSLGRGVSAPVEGTPTVGTTPHKRFSMDMINPLSNLGGTNNGDTPSRFSLTSAGKQISFLNPMPMVQTLNPMPIVTNMIPQRNNSTTERPKRVKRASITSSNLPSDLGLEAGLFMEQRNLSLGSSQHVSRRQMRRMSGESLDSFEDGEPRRRRRPPRRTKSGDDVDEESPWRRTRVRRVKSSDDITLFDDENDPLEASNRSKADSVSLTEMQKSLRQPRPISKRQEEAKQNATFPESPGTIKSDGGDSIWDKIERDKARKSKLRAKLDSMQNLQNTPSTESGNSRSSDDLPIDISGASLPSLPKHLTDEPSRKVSATKTRRFDDPPTTDKMPPILPARSWRERNESEPDAGRDMSTPNDNQHPNHRAKRVHLKKASNDWESVDNNMAAINENESSSEASQSLVERQHSQSNFNDFQGSRRSLSSQPMDDNLRIALNFEATAGLREPENDAGPRRRLNTSNTDKWSKVVSIIKDADTNGETTKGRKIASGKWKVLTPRQIFYKLRSRVMKILGRSTELLTQKPDMVEELTRHSSYAVVTFTSRQAAVAARHCLADSRGADRWVTVGEIPSPPLADAPVCNMSSFRGCVRPVTLSISDKQKLLRKNLAIAALATIYFFYTIPLTAAQQLVSPETLSRLIPDILEWQKNSLFVANIFSGFIPALVWTGFFAICPPMFKVISNFGSNATSSVIAENTALHYFWWFMVVSAFTGASLSTAIVDGFNEGIRIGAEIQTVIETTAAAIPTQVSATWLNWMILRVTIVLPTQYLLQLNTFLFSFFGLTCCARTVRGGGSGGPVPYRIYVDSGVVMLCVFGLAPASPLIAPAAFVYFLFCTPMLRWTMIFLYKPKFDIGGQRFPFIFDMCISGMIVGQILLVTMMTLKRAIGPACAAFCPMIPTILYRWVLRRRYLRAFNDAALLQTSLLDGWDTNQETCEAKREEFRRFLIDCHKAAYVPVCIASGDITASITAEPAVVVPTEADEDFTDTGSQYGESIQESESKVGSLPSKFSQQFDASSRRTSTSVQPGQMLRRASGVIKQTHIPGLFGDDTSNSETGHDFLPVEQAPTRLFPSPRRVSTRKTVTGSGFNAGASEKGNDTFSVYSQTPSFGSPRLAGQRRVVGNPPVSPFGSPDPSDVTPTTSPRRVSRKLSNGMPKSPML